MQSLDSAYIENYKDYHPCDLIDIAKRRGIYASEVQDQILEFNNRNPDADLQTLSITDDPEAIEQGTDVLLVTNQGTFVLYPDGGTESVENGLRVQRSQAAKKGKINQTAAMQCALDIKKLLYKADIVDYPQLIRIKNKKSCVLIYVYANQNSRYALRKHQRGDFKELEDVHKDNHIDFVLALSDIYMTDVERIARREADKAGLDVECGQGSELEKEGKLQESDLKTEYEYYAFIIILSQPKS